MAGRIHRSSANLPETFQDGYFQFLKLNYQQALHKFEKTLEQTSKSDPRRNKFDSYYGLCKVMLGDASGLVICRRAADLEGFDGDVYANLALAEFKCNCRRRAFAALQRGIKIDPYLTRLRLIYNKMDRRKPVFIPALGRNHPINRFFGLMKHKMIAYRAKKADMHTDNAIMDLCLSKRSFV